MLPPSRAVHGSPHCVHRSLGAFLNMLNQIQQMAFPHLAILTNFMGRPCSLDPIFEQQLSDDVLSQLVSQWCKHMTKRNREYWIV